MKVVIIGAGPAGLTAAYELLKKTDIKPVILEASGEIGGISRTHKHNGKRMDLGGHRFFSKNKEVMDFWLSICPMQGAPAIDDIILKRDKKLEPGGPDPEKTERVMLLRNRVSRILYLRKFFDYPITLKLSTIASLGFFRTVKAGFGYIWSAIFKRKENSLEDFFINRFGRPLYSMFFEDYNRKVWGISPAQMAPDWGSQRVKGLSLMKAVSHMFLSLFKKKGAVETSLIEEFYYPKQGPGQLWEAVAADILRMGGEILLNSEVSAIALNGGNIASVTANGTEYPADIFISSMPIKELIAALTPDEKVPAEVKDIAKALPYRDFMTVGLLVDNLLLKNKTHIATVGDIVPDCWIYIQERDVKIGRMQIFNNWSPYMLENPEDGVWIGLEYFCDEGDEMWETPDEEFIRFAINELVKINIIASPDCVRDSVRLRVKKAYPGYFGVYEKFPVVKTYLDTIENLYCIGRNGQHRYNNMDHSMLTAMETVKAIIAGSTDKTAVWNVNTEEEYHEETK